MAKTDILPMGTVIENRVGDAFETVAECLVREAAKEKAEREAEERKRLDCLFTSFRS